VSDEVRAIAKFVEKPDQAKAAKYVKAGYLWNSGNFMFRASAP
jgi:mannose-1-phosphate guanylyltransferase